MVEKTLTLSETSGLQGRPASIFVQTAAGFDSDIFIEQNERIYNGKSIMSILSMGAGKGSTITMRIEGSDEENAMQTLIELLENRLSDF